ncbi:MAG: hypothetical protein J0M34_03175 [Alphaproteobacteria bacterium]|nr:hypothetical protein [Alphaproteobacteria bacterium]
MTQIRSGNPFLRAAETGVIKRPETKQEMRATSALRAVVNYFPSDSELGEMINNALTALRRGIYWDRGSIVNLQV